MLSETRICWEPIENLQVEYVICMEITSCTRNIIKYKIKKRYKHITNKKERNQPKEKEEQTKKKITQNYEMKYQLDVVGHGFTSILPFS